MARLLAAAGAPARHDVRPRECRAPTRRDPRAAAGERRAGTSRTGRGGRDHRGRARRRRARDGRDRRHTAQSVHNLGDGPVADRSLRRAARTVVANGARARELHEHAGRRVAGAHRRRAGGPRRGCARARRRVREAAPAVRRADRIVPGPAAQAGRRGHRASTAPACWHARRRGRPTRARPTRRRAGRAWRSCSRPDAAQPATAVALHVHGGYGFTLEYDIQLYHRRAKAWPLRPRRPAREERCTSPTRCSARSVEAPLMDFRLGERSDAFREEVREFLARALPARHGRTGARHRDRAQLGPLPGARRAGLDRGVLARGVRRAGA